MSGLASNEKRWVVLSEDGRFITLGRASDPSEAEIQAAEGALRSQRMAGWLAIMDGNPYERVPPALLEVRALATPKGSFSEASAKLLSRLSQKEPS